MSRCSCWINDTPLGTAVRWGSLLPPGYCPPLTPERCAFFGYKDELPLPVRLEGTGHVLERMRLGLVTMELEPRNSPFQRFVGPYNSTGVVVLSPRSSLLEKDWNQQHWTSLISELDKLQVPWEWETQGDLWELETQLRAASLVIGSDSGPLHLADHMGIPVLGLYGVTSPEVHGPCGPDAQVLYNPMGVNHISVESVLRKVKKK